MRIQRPEGQVSLLRSHSREGRRGMQTQVSPQGPSAACSAGCIRTNERQPGPGRGPAFRQQGLSTGALFSPSRDLLYHSHVAVRCRHSCRSPGQKGVLRCCVPAGVVELLCGPHGACTEPGTPALPSPELFEVLTQAQLCTQVPSSQLAARPPSSSAPEPVPVGAASCPPPCEPRMLPPPPRLC